MKRLFAAALVLFSTFAFAEAVPGQPAPGFRLNDINGKAVSLSDFKGKYVVLEWNNPNCPFVNKQYSSGNMQMLQKRFTAQNVAWLAVNSTTESSADYVAPNKLGMWLKDEGAAPTALLMDSKGVTGRAYNARATPQMVVIDPKGMVIYNGAIDDKRSANPADAKTAHNYVAAALTEAMNGKPVSMASSQPYGCSVKYD